MGQIERALELVEEYHAGIEYGPGVSYVEGHLIPVRDEVISLGYDDEDTLTAALLHDIVEDTEMTLEGLRERAFRPTVVESVDALSMRDNESKRAYLGRIILVPRAVPVKFADSTRNLRSTLLAGPSHPKYLRWLEKYPDNLRYLYPHLPRPEDLRSN